MYNHKTNCKYVNLMQSVNSSGSILQYFDRHRKDDDALKQLENIKNLKSTYIKTSVDV